MRLSVITAVFNREDSVARCLSSVTSQTFSDVEQVVIDGGSSDSTVEIASKILSASDKLISEPDDGIYDAFNKGVQASTGDVIAFLNSDDAYTGDHVLHLVMESFLKSQVDIVIGGVTIHSTKGKLFSRRRYRPSTVDINALQRGFMPPHPGIFIKRSVYDDLGLFDTSFSIAGDYEFLCRVAKRGGYSQLVIDTDVVKMEAGGASSSGLAATIRLNSEVLRALRMNNLRASRFSLLVKYLRKMTEYYN